MTIDRLAARQNKLVHSIRKAGISALLVTNPNNVTYLTGFTGEDSYLLIGPDQLQVFSDSRFETQLQDECPNVAAQIRTSRTTMSEFLGQELVKFKLSSLGIEASSMTVSTHDSLAEKLSSLQLVPKSGLVEELRQIKDPGEIEGGTWLQVDEVVINAGNDRTSGGT
jgi:Xaa-Pro aminopeptidase